MRLARCQASRKPCTQNIAASSQLRGAYPRAHDAYSTANTAKLADQTYCYPAYAEAEREKAKAKLAHFRAYLAAEAPSHEAPSHDEEYWLSGGVR